MSLLEKEASKNLGILRKINTAILNLELRLSLNAQSLIHSSELRNKNGISNEALKKHNQRAQAVIDECQISLEKLSYLQLHYRSLPEDQLHQIFSNYHKTDIKDIQKMIEQLKLTY